MNTLPFYLRFWCHCCYLLFKDTSSASRRIKPFTKWDLNPAPLDLEAFGQPLCYNCCPGSVAAPSSIQPCSTKKSFFKRSHNDGKNEKAILSLLLLLGAFVLGKRNTTINSILWTSKHARFWAFFFLAVNRVLLNYSALRKWKSS